MNYFFLYKNLSSNRLANFIKIKISYLFSLIIKKPKIWGLPVSISVEPTNYCNLRCPECPSGSENLTRKRGNMNIDLYTKIIEQLNNATSYLNLYFQGEPYLNKNFFEMVKIATGKKMFVDCSTNGHFLNESNCRETINSGLSRLIISLDGTDQEKYEKYRKKGEIDIVLNGIRNIIRIKKETGASNPVIALQFLIMKHNENQIDEFRKLAKEMGTDQIILKTVQINDPTDKNQLIPSKDKYSRYRLNDSAHYKIKNRLKNKCMRSWGSCVITWDGYVVPCCFDKDAEHILGDLSSDSFRSIWHSRKYHKFRSALLKNRKNINICNNCIEGSRTII